MDRNNIIARLRYIYWIGCIFDTYNKYLNMAWAVFIIMCLHLFLFASPFFFFLIFKWWLLLDDLIYSVSLAFSFLEMYVVYTCYFKNILCRYACSFCVSYFLLSSLILHILSYASWDFWISDFWFEVSKILIQKSYISFVWNGSLHWEVYVEVWIYKIIF